MKNFILISYLFEIWRINQNKMNELEKNLMLFELDENNESFNEVEIANKEIKEHLKSDLIYIIVSRHNKEIMIWHGSNTNIRMKFIATQEVPKIRDQFGIDYKISAIDEGDESFVFKQIAGL